jgi:hypothetical protein
MPAKSLGAFPDLISYFVEMLKRGETIHPQKMK